MKKIQPTQPISNRLEFMNQYINDSINEVTKESEQMISMKNLQEKILTESNELALQIANSIKYKDSKLPKKFSGINLANKDKESFEFIKFQLVLDFLESSGCKFTPGVFRHETQNPTILLDRIHLSEILHLRSYDKTPLLVQLIEMIRANQNNE